MKNNEIDAEELLKAEYEKKFREKPGPNEQMAIRVLAPRVKAGEAFVWIDDGDFRRLKLVK